MRQPRQPYNTLRQLKMAVDILHILNLLAPESLPTPIREISSGNGVKHHENPDWEGPILSFLKSVVSDTKIADLQANIAPLGGTIWACRSAILVSLTTDFKKLKIGP